MSGRELRVRPARPADQAALGALTVQAYLSGELLAADDPYLDELGDVARRAEGCELLVAVAGDLLLGGVSLVLSGSPQREVARSGEAEVRTLAVAPAHRGAGVASALMQSCQLRARELGYEALVLSVLERNAPAHALYQRLGFTRAPERDWSPAPHVDLLVHRLPLSGAARADGHVSPAARPVS